MGRTHSPCQPKPLSGRLGSPLSVGQRNPPPPTHTPPLVREMCPRLVGFTWRGRRGPFFSILLPPQLSAPPLLWPLAAWSASSLRKARCRLLPSDLSSHSGGLFKDPLSPTHIPTVPLPRRANPAPPSATRLYRGAPGEPGEQTQQIAERERAEPVCSARSPPPRPAPAAQTPALQARVSLPFRCSSQDRGRASPRGSPGPCQSPSLLRDRLRKPGSGRRGPAPACARGEGDTVPADPSSPEPRRLRGREWQEGRPGPGLVDPYAPYRFPWVDTPLDTRAWTLLSNQERRGVIAHPRPFPGPGSVPRAGFPSSAPAKGLGAGGNSSRSPRCQAGIGACGSGGWGVGAGVSPFSSLLCAPPAATAASSLPSPRRDTYRGRAAPRGRAGRRRRGPTSLGPWPGRERLVAKGATVDGDLAPERAWSHPTPDGRGAPLSLLKLWGPGCAIQGHFEGRVVPGAAGYTRGAGGGAARGGRSLHLPGWCPLQDLCGEGGAARAVRGPVASGVSGAV